jgi:glycerol uptake facilitator protein
VAQGAQLHHRIGRRRVRRRGARLRGLQGCDRLLRAGVAIGISFGANAGYAINPARDFGPRLFALIAGWGDIAIPGDYGNVNSYLWIPIVGPFVGGAIGAVVYDLFIRDTLRARGEPEPPDVEPRGRAVLDE